MAPATLHVGMGLTYTSPDNRLPFIVTMNAVSGDGLFVVDDRIPDARRVKLGIPVARDSEGRLINYKLLGGSSLNINFNRKFSFGKEKWLSIQYNTNIYSFYGWITNVSRREPVGDTPAPPEIKPTLDWNNSLNINPWKYLTLQFTTRTVYDKSQVDKVQMQYFLSIGLSYNYKNK
jgi:hypothetical protein